MRAILVERYGPPEVMTWKTVDDPRPAEGQVLVRVRAVGINFAELLQRMGLYPGTPKPPFIPGLEVSGVVERVVPGQSSAGAANALHPGDRVVALASFGAYAELLACPAATVFRLPDGISFADSAAIPVNYVTAYHSMFHMGNLQPGDRILIHRAAGEPGDTPAQLAPALVHGAFPRPGRGAAK